MPCARDTLSFSLIDRGSCLRRCWRRSCCAYGHKGVCGPLDALLPLYGNVYCIYREVPRAHCVYFYIFTCVSTFITATHTSGHTHNTRYVCMYARASTTDGLQHP